MRIFAIPKQLNKADGPKAAIMKNFINSYDRVKCAIESGKAINIFNIVDGDFVGMGEFEYSDEAMIIIELVAKNGEGFVIDICNRVLESINAGKAITLSDKQRWCIAFAANKISTGKVDELRELNNTDANTVEVEVSKDKIIEEAEANVKCIEIGGVRLQIINRNTEVIIYDFDKWEDIERIANILHLDQFERQPVIIKQRAGSAKWDWTNIGNAWDGLNFENNINPITGDEDYSSYMKLTEDSTTYAIAIIIKK